MRPLITILLFLLVGCAQTPTQDSKPEHHHHHQAPHGGTLIVFGQELAHLELLLDEAGQLTGYVLDGGAENGVRLRGTVLEIEIEMLNGQTGTVVLNPVADELTGETAEETSQFRGSSELLKGATAFTGTLKKIEVKGQLFENTQFRFPEGNEH